MLTTPTTELDELEAAPDFLPENGKRVAPVSKSGGGRPDAYKLDGVKIPSVSTIIKRFQPADGLIAWAHRQGMEGVPLHEARDKAAAIGASVHDAIEAHVGGTPWEDCEKRLVATAADMEDADKALSSFGAFRRWYEEQRLEILATETPLVSRKHKYGGTPDCLARNIRALLMLDWKTGKGVVYAEHIVQCVAYAKLWEENHGELPAEIHILRPSKNTGGFNHFCIPMSACGDAWEYFLSIRRAAHFDKKVRALLG